MGDQLLLNRQRHGLIKQAFEQAPLRKAPLPVLRKRGVIPRHLIQIQPDKPAEDQVARQLTHQGAFRGDAQQITAQERQKQLLRWNGGAPHLGIERFAELPNPHGVDQRPDLPYRMIGGHKLLQIDEVEHRREIMSNVGYAAFWEQLFLMVP